MHDPHTPREFQAARWMIAAVIVTDLLFAAGASASYRARGAGILTVLLAGFAAVGMLGLIDVVTTRIVLARDALHVVKPWSRRSYQRAAIRTAAAEKGSAVALVLTDGRRARLPDLGQSSQRMAGAIRDWLRAAL